MRTNRSDSTNSQSSAAAGAALDAARTTGTGRAVLDVADWIGIARMASTAINQKTLHRFMFHPHRSQASAQAPAQKQRQGQQHLSPPPDLPQVVFRMPFRTEFSAFSDLAGPAPVSTAQSHGFLSPFLLPLALLQ
jgi:hypothetical protein